MFQPKTPRGTQQTKKESPKTTRSSTSTRSRTTTGSTRNGKASMMMTIKDEESGELSDVADDLETPHQHQLDGPELDQKEEDDGDKDDEPSRPLPSFKNTLFSYSFTKLAKNSERSGQTPKMQAATPSLTPLMSETSTGLSSDVAPTALKRSLPRKRPAAVAPSTPKKKKKRASMQVKTDDTDQAATVVDTSLATGHLSTSDPSTTLTVVDEGSSMTVQYQTKQKKTASGYAPPERYAHLNYLQDAIAPGLICLFVGTNPGIRTAEKGHAYSHPTNHFWRELFQSGCTTRLCQPCEDQDLPRLFSLGNTNIVARPTKNQSELTFDEMVQGTATLETKIRLYQPEAVCIVGVGIWRAIWKAKTGKKMRPGELRYGWQDPPHNMGRFRNAADAEQTLGGNRTTWDGARVFVNTSTSGLAAIPPEIRSDRWRQLGDWVVQRRAERERITMTNPGGETIE